MIRLKDTRYPNTAAFLASAAYLAAMLGGAAFALYPVLLPSSNDPARALTIAAAATSSHAMRVAAVWWLFAFLLVLATFRYLYASFRGKVTAADTHGVHAHTFESPLRAGVDPQRLNQLVDEIDVDRDSGRHR